MPLIRLLSLFLFWNEKVEARERFEKKNKFEALAHSFKEKNIQADLCFEFSSEGEFEQVAPLVQDALKLGKKIELVFFSPSVENTVLKLAGEYPQQIRYLRYPLVRIIPFIPRRSFTHWVSAKKLVMVRYDLFPEFLLWSLHPQHELKMIWMTFKKERSRNRSISFWKKCFLKSSKALVFAGSADLAQSEAMGLSGKVFDFRIEQIRRRLVNRMDKFNKQFSIYSDLKTQIEKFPKRLIVGNAWPSDLVLLRDLPLDVMLVVVPHSLKPEIIQTFKEMLRALGREAFELRDGERELVVSSTILVNKSGVLCELYADFPFAYVGGGFEGSIHSVLEPLISGSSYIACGPSHHRSTEYDLVQDAGQMTELNTPEQFKEWLKKPISSPDHARIVSLVNGYESLREFVVSC